MLHLTITVHNELIKEDSAEEKNECTIRENVDVS